MTKPRPFFIVGSDRSGTTMLRLMLNEHPELHIPPETWFIIDLMNSLLLNKQLSPSQIDAAFHIITKHKRWKDLDIKNTLLGEKLAELNRPLLREVIETVFTILIERSGKIRWGDKTPDYLREIVRLHIVFPDAQFIHVIRDSRDVCISLIQKKWRGTRTPNAARYWSNCVREGIAAGRQLPNELYMEVAYEDIVLNTEKMLKIICSFLNVEFASSMLHFYKNAAGNIAPRGFEHHQKTMRPPKKEDVFRWKKEGSFIQVFAVEAVAGKTMDLVGQKRRFRGVGRILTWMFGILEELFVTALQLRRKLGIHWPS
jgi:hypothetical protein